jgi:hypothetical protein
MSNACTQLTPSNLDSMTSGTTITVNESKSSLLETNTNNNSNKLAEIVVDNSQATSNTNNSNAININSSLTSNNSETSSSASSSSSSSASSIAMTSSTTNTSLTSNSLQMQASNVQPQQQQQQAQAAIQQIHQQQNLNHYNASQHAIPGTIQYFQYPSTNTTPVNVSPLSSLTSSPSTTNTPTFHHHHHHHSQFHANHLPPGAIAINPNLIQQQQLHAFNPNFKDTRWLTLEVCREYQRNKCNRTETECKFAHPPAHVESVNGKVIACYDSLKVFFNF